MKLFFSFLFLVTGQIIFAQIQGSGGLPKSNKQALDEKSIQEWYFAQPNIAALQAEDALIDDQGVAPWRFGFNNHTNITTTNAGTWFDLPNGAKLWMLKVKCQGALTVNLTFEQTHIPAGNQLFAYNPSKDFILGAFTQQHIYDGQLGTELIPGEQAILEYYVAPQNEIGHIQLAVVTHGYRTANEFVNKAFGSSGSCNMNVNCNDGLPWTQQRNSAVMLVSGSSGFCSGALINNTLNDGKPYVLTANHCYSNPANWIFRFNWQASNCNNPASSPTFQSLSGAVLRSRRTPSDFCLVEITGGLVNGSVPLDYNPYFSGWDKSGTIPSSTVSIHHPSGDIKKISFDDNAATISQGMGSNEANSTWTVQWDRNTTTEGGSSGSPLFDQNHRIIGQLWGGGASCQNQTAPDYYGRVANSWEPAGSNSTNQLKFWLDPNASGAAFIDGFDPNNATVVALDAALSSAQLTALELCDDNYLPTVSIMNVGSTTITTALVSYQIDNGAVQQYNWSGTLAQWQAQTISLPQVQLAPGAHNFSATVSNPNQALDENANNNQASLNMNVLAIPETIDSIRISLLTDDYANETYLELLDANGVMVWSEGNENVASNFGTGAFPAPNDATNPLQNNTTYDFTVPLSAIDCYTLVIYDYYGDGMGAAQWGGTDGEWIVADHNNNVIYSLANADFGDSAYVVIKNIDDAGFEELDFGWKISPNPAHSILDIDWTENENVEIEVVDMFGKVVLAQGHQGIACVMNVAALKSGAYVLRLKRTNGQILQQKLIKN